MSDLILSNEIDIIKYFIDHIKGIDDYNTKYQVNYMFNKLCEFTSSYELLEYMITKKNININRADEMEKYPIQYLCENNNHTFEMVKLLIDNGLDLDLNYNYGKSNKSAKRPINTIMKHCNTKTIQYLFTPRFNFFTTR